VLPTTWRTAIVLPLPKSGNPTSLMDVRPISILPVLLKVIEKILCVISSLIILSLVVFQSRFQSGFRRFHNTATALTRITDGVL
jgi:hypothetical protein